MGWATGSRNSEVVAEAAFGESCRRRRHLGSSLHDPKLPSTARNKAHVHGQPKHTLAKVSGVATKRIVPSWSHCCKIACVLQLRSCEGRACHETQRKALIRSQSISVESKRGASHFRLSEGSNCLYAGYTRGFWFLHSERQGQEHRCLRAGEGSRGRSSGNRRFLWGRVLDRTTAASGNSLRCYGMRDRANNKGRHYPRDPRRASVRRVIYRAPLGSQQSC